MEYVTGTVKAIVGIFDNAYKQGWMLYLIVALIMLAVAIMFWK